MTIAIGCTGGKHRSVAMAEAVGRAADAPTGWRPSSCTATWGASDRAGRRRAGRRPRPGRLADRPALRHRRDHRASSRSPTTAGRPAGCATSSACCHRATCGWPWRRCASETEWGQTWRDVLQHRFAGDGPARRARPRQPADRRPLGAARGPRRRARPRRPAAPGPRPGAADGRGAARPSRPTSPGSTPTDPDAVHARQRAGAGRGHARARSVRLRLVPADPPAYPESVAAIRSADWVDARARLVVHLGDAAPARARPARGARGHPGPPAARAQPRAR